MQLLRVFNLGSYHISRKNIDMEIQCFLEKLKLTQKLFNKIKGRANKKKRRIKIC